MPSLITHDYFGQQALTRNAFTATWSQDQKDAFLLGNQGPDPFFYAVVSPRLRRFSRVGSVMHDEKPSELFVMMHKSVQWLAPEDQGIGQAYLCGFYGHYVLDTTVHPFVFSQEYAICDAGIEGLTRKDGGEVHATIERELDELVLYIKLGKTVATYKPYREILRASDQVLKVISRMFSLALYRTYGMALPDNMFVTCVHNFRKIQHLFYSPEGKKRSLVGRTEGLFRAYSFYDSMSHRAVERTSSVFANAEHQVWEDPFAGTQRTESFQDLFDEALAYTPAAFELLQQEVISEDEVHRALTHGRDFSGRVVE